MKFYSMKVTNMNWLAPDGSFPGKAQSWKTTLLFSKDTTNWLVTTSKGLEKIYILMPLSC